PNKGKLLNRTRHKIAYILSELGISPVMSVPYVISLYIPFTFGSCVAAEQIILLVLQKIILKSDFEMRALLQLPTAILFGVFCDVALSLYSSISFSEYYQRFFSLCLGICILAVGLSFQFIANISVAAPDGFMLALAHRFKSSYSRVKVSVDWLFVAVSVGISFMFFKELHGVREGTLISALSVGTAVGIARPWVHKYLTRWMAAYSSGEGELRETNEG
ncbi:YczE/YyaS/YitT family protein, partial [Turicimonas muris]